MAAVVVSIVTHESAPTIQRCVESLRQQTFKDFELSVVDNASRDDTVSVLRACGVDPIRNARNEGFCAAQNQILEASRSSYVLVLNPDTELAPDFLEELVSALERHPSAGSACGKLLRLVQDARSSIIDSAGMILRPTQRHFDRGAGEADTGQYDTAGWVFGATGAAVLYRRTFLEDVREENGVFDPGFFAFREDADLSWRGQWLGWGCLYWPRAVAWHTRRVTPERRSQLPPEINYHSVKNRFLMRLKNLDTRSYLRHFLPITLRDTGIAAYILLRERSSLPAFAYVWAHRQEYLRRRKALRRRRRAGWKEVDSWFHTEVVNLDESA